MIQSLGICVGASTVSFVKLGLNGARPEILERVSKAHDGNPRDMLKSMLQSMNIDSNTPLAVTGRQFKDSINLSRISEPQAVEYALKYVNPDGRPVDAVISAGGETFILYSLDKNGKITRVYTGNKCASGTGEFFLQQTRRMDVDLDEAIVLSRNEEPHQVSGRCSVFCKSDCTHATNIGIPKGQVVAGLSHMMAQKVLELLKSTDRKNIMIVGGTTRIEVMVDHLQKEIDNLIIPDEATIFEALGAGLWALENGCHTLPDIKALFRDHISQFDFHEPLNRFASQVQFKTQERGTAQPGDKCILGLDVGSTTTKAILLRISDLKILTAEYLRTNGDPVKASRECYRALKQQLNGTAVEIGGLGVTGSGRKIAGLHAQTDGVINEIIAHAEAAIHFDPEVDTIFEIGGQDAKYTYITNGVASDYAMNEACSAGTGSFLEESALETLGIEMEDIADWALKGQRPPNFNDQCAAFISSDIKSTAQEGIPKEDIVAGLVYSICMNYVNRVKGARPVGKKVFMQGGVCYNRAIPLAMAALSDKEIIVPPEPGLMGAYGVALEVLHRIEKGLLKHQSFDLDQLIDRDVHYKKSIICKGGREKCDLKCEISRIVIEDRTIPFGGACNLFYNLRQKIQIEPGEHDFVVKRQQLVYQDYAPDTSHIRPDAPTIGLSRSLMMNTYYPLFAHFFVELGLRPVLAEQVDQQGIDQCAAAFCYPCEISHGYFRNLLEMEPDYVFLPHITGMAVKNGSSPARTCPLVQGEPYYLINTFLYKRPGGPIPLSPVIDLEASVEKQAEALLALIPTLKVKKTQIRAAYLKAARVQAEMQDKMQRIGRQVLEKIESDPQQIAVIMFGRPYNAYVPEANKGIPHKFASRGVTVIPVDFLDLEAEPVKDHMFWAQGQINLKGAEFIKKHPQLFGTFITNFSCGPDSFIVGYFRDILGKKPSLTLELDNHTADAGLETRIEAFLDIVARYRKIPATTKIEEPRSAYQPARSWLKDGKYTIVTSGGETTNLWDPRVKLVFCSIGRFMTEAIGAAYQGMNVNTVAIPELTMEELKIGRGNTTCKECLPLQLTTGALLKYLQEEREVDEITVYFVPTADGPCRFGQYRDFMRDYIKKNRIRDVTFFSMSSHDGYGGLGQRFTLSIWKTVILADLFEDIYHTLLVLATDRDQALTVFEDAWSRVKKALSVNPDTFDQALEEAVELLQTIPRKQSLEATPQVLIVGEIYVRKEGISRRWLPERLIAEGIIPLVSPFHEWGIYVDWLHRERLVTGAQNRWKRFGKAIERRIKIRVERRLKRILARSGWLKPRFIDVDHLIAAGEHFISRHLPGEAILTVGGPYAEVGEEYCGAIAIGPFGCMPNRLGEAILNLGMDQEHIRQFRRKGKIKALTDEIQNLPFLAIESDGNPFPQLIEARLETFIMQAKRTHAAMQRIGI